MSLGTTVSHAGRSHMKPQAPEAFAAFVGLDWADAKHDICLQVAGSTHREFLHLEHRPEVIDAWVCTLRTRFNGQPIAVCLELNKGPIVSALQNIAPVTERSGKKSWGHWRWQCPTFLRQTFGEWAAESIRH